MTMKTLRLPTRARRLMRAILLGWACAPSLGQAHPSEGLWVGSAVLNQVNEVVSAVDENNVRVQTRPQQTTPTSDQAEIFVIVHVDAGGQARLLKSVVIVDGDDDPLTVTESLLTDPDLFADYPIARRIASVAYEFGDPASRVVVGDIATAAATAAAASASSPQQAYTDALAGASAAIAAAAQATHSPSLAAFVAGTSFQGSAVAAATAARDTAELGYGDGLRGGELVDAVRSGVLIGLQNLSQMGDSATLRELPLTGSLERGGVLEGEIFLGAYHPTNPFRHRRNPAHRGGYDIHRDIRLTVGTSGAGVGFDTTDRGIDRLTGDYEEEVRGLHKPLGQSGEYGLRTKGTFVLDRISHDATLND